jgi:hypothetical protein
MAKHKSIELLAGFSSRIPNTKYHIFMCDCDNIPERKAVKAIKILQHDYSKMLGTVMLVRSSRGHYHLYSFYKFTKNECILMLFNLLEHGYVDSNYVKFSFLRPSKTLRFSKKLSKGTPVYINEFKSLTCKRKELISMKHLVINVLKISRNQETITTFRMSDKNE